jgi:hypothetical protein
VKKRNSGEDACNTDRDHRLPMLRPSANLQKEMILFIEMEYNVEEGLESPEHCINLLNLPIKNLLVSFLPNEIHRDT